jgi:hypothetical protein
MTDSVSTLLNAIETGTPVPDGVLADDVVLDATVPMWRLTLQGVDAFRERFSIWFADPGKYESIERIPTPDGEIVQLVLTWVENGIPFLARQAHFLQVDDTGRITRDAMYCGGRWDAAKQAEIEDAHRVSA